MAEAHGFDQEKAEAFQTNQGLDFVSLNCNEPRFALSNLV